VNKEIKEYLEDYEDLVLDLEGEITEMFLDIQELEEDAESMRCTISDLEEDLAEAYTLVDHLRERNYSLEKTLQYCNEYIEELEEEAEETREEELASAYREDSRSCDEEGHEGYLINKEEDITDDHSFPPTKKRRVIDTYDTLWYDVDKLFQNKNIKVNFPQTEEV
jgi:chromosome segregation ATPase